MTPSELATPNARGPVRDRDAARACSLAGITSAQQRAATLRQLKAGLDTAIADLDREHKVERFAHRGLMVARWTKATCETFVGMAGELGGLLLPEPAAKGARAVAQASAVVTPLAEAASTIGHGARPELSLAADATKAAVGNAGLATKLLTKSAVVKVEVINSAMNHEGKGLTKKAVDYAIELHTDILDEVGAKKTVAFVNLAKLAFQYNEALGSAADELIEADVDSVQRHRALKGTILTQSRNISATIDRLDEYVRFCQQEASHEDVRFSGKGR